MLQSQRRLGYERDDLSQPLIDFMLARPILIRPIVETPKGTRLCRPSELVLDLPEHPVMSYVKGNGEVVTRARS